MVVRTILRALSILLSLLAAMPASADESPVAWVGRVSAVEGSLSIRPKGGDWADSAVVNDPVAAGMAVKTSAQGRALLRFGPETIALAPGTELTIGQVDSSGSQFTLQQGRIGVRLASAEPALSIEIDSPRGGIWILAPGDYDIAAGDDHTSGRVAAFDGRARIVGKDLDRIVTTGSAVVLSGANPVTASLEGAGGDEFAAWSHPAGTSNDAPLPGYVSAEMTGYDALDGAGTWETMTGIGPVWFPKDISADWAPYRNGHWRSVAPWGWTWIDDAPWGFAPSHYGRWARLPAAETAAGSDADPVVDPAADPPGGDTERWGWVPGSLVQHPAYMPAAVAFLGTAGVGISYPDAFGPAVAWFPLAPDEPYWPRYTKDPDAVRRVNVGNVTDLAALKPGDDGGPPAAVVNGRYQNRRYASVVPRSVFLGGKPVAPALVSLPEQRLKDAPLLAGSPQINPAPPPVAVATTVSAASRNSPTSRKMVSTMKTQALARVLSARRVVAPVLRPAPRKPVMLAIARQRGLALSRSASRVVAVKIPRAGPRAARPTVRFATVARHGNR